VVVIAILAGAGFVSSRYQRTSQKCEKECNDINPPTTAPSGTTGDCYSKCEQDAERNLPSWYRIFVWPQGIEALAILLTLLVIAEQTFHTRRSADAAKKSAKAALLNARALIKAERAWIMADLDWPNSSKPTQTVSDSGEPITSVPFLLRCFNEGKTPCWITEKRVCAQIVDTIPEKPEMEKLRPMWVGVDPVKVSKEASLLQGGIGLLGHRRIDQTLIIWGVVTYRDAFNENLETFWGYYYRPETSGPYLHRIPISAYNQTT
jgi:hypothetical protein